jgi:hypothetical protein
MCLSQQSACRTGGFTQTNSSPDFGLLLHILALLVEVEWHLFCLASAIESWVRVYMAPEALCALAALSMFKRSAVSIFVTAL